MKKMLTIWIIIAILLVSVLTYMGVNMKNKNGDYYNLEKKLTSAAKVYYGQYPNQLPASELVITSTKLLKENFLEDLNNGIEVCNGYVVVKKSAMSYNYKSYIKCDIYSTKNYDSNLFGENV